MNEQKKVYKFLRNSRLVCRDFEHVVTPLLYRDVVLTNPRHASLLLSLLDSPSSSSLLPHIRTFTWLTWDHPEIEINYPNVTSLRALLIHLLLPSPTLVECSFPTLAWPLLTPFATTPPHGLRRLGTILAVNNIEMSKALDTPLFSELEELGIWWGDVASGALRLPPSLRSLKIRCDHFHHGNHVPFPPLPNPETDQHLPLLTHLSFSFTTQIYPGASPLPPVPFLLSAVGARIERISLFGDRNAKANDIRLPPEVFSLCPKLKILELGNHRVVPGSGLVPSSSSLERIHFRFDSVYPLEDTQCHDQLVLREVADVVRVHGGKLPKLKTLLLLGVPEEVTLRWEVVLERLFDLEKLGVTVIDQRGRNLDGMMPGNVRSSLPPSCMFESLSSASRLSLPTPPPSRNPSTLDSTWTDSSVDYDEAYDSCSTVSITSEGTTSPHPTSNP
ncbi:hypothetical protein BDY24DRAFT_417838 [Mrakia frigida]|uniref:uncharacterized protein n=1 Tax=Mrakia frigida TaxID=29902 RepID=UPI003FCBF142